MPIDWGPRTRGGQVGPAQEVGSEPWPEKGAGNYGTQPPDSPPAPPLTPCIRHGRNKKGARPKAAKRAYAAALAFMGAGSGLG